MFAGAMQAPCDRPADAEVTTPVLYAQWGIYSRGWLDVAGRAVQVLDRLVGGEGVRGRWLEMTFFVGRGA